MEVRKSFKEIIYGEEKSDWNLSFEQFLWNGLEWHEAMNLSYQSCIIQCTSVMLI